MPVEDHEVHERTRITDEFRYGCWNKSREVEGYCAPNRLYYPDGSFVVTQLFVPSVMSIECRFDMSLSDPACTGCKWRGTGEDYDSMVRLSGKT